MSLSNDNRWRETADAATRAQYPDEYWCVADDGELCGRLGDEVDQAAW